MKYTFFTLFMLFSILSVGQNSYFFPEGSSFDKQIPAPESVLGYEIGEFHTRHDAIVSYLKTLAQESSKATFEVIGYTHEKRPQVVLTVTSEANLRNLETIREQHLANADPEKPASDGPAIVWLGYNVHGNEPSSSEAALLTAYWLCASEDVKVNSYLENTVVLIDPSFNPDGRDRHTTWVNANKGFPPSPDPVDREHNEAWPGGRGNHYSFDLNRDWLPLTQPESQNRVRFFHQWLPHVVTDFHEMGTNSTYFFEPTEPFGSENPVVPRANYDQLNNLFATYFAEAMDEMGALYFTKEVYDNSYPGYGSTYPDIHGGLGLVFEQASSRGHLQESSTGEVEFRFTIRNHLRNSMATVKAASENTAVLQNHQRDFFVTAVDEGNRSGTKGYLFGMPGNPGRANAFLQLLLDHQIEVYGLQKEVSASGQSYKPNEAYVVPTDQKQYRMVRTMFEKVTQFHDSVFYDASAWTVALAYGVEYSAYASSLPLGERVMAVPKVTPEAPKSTSYAWLIDVGTDQVYRAAYELLRAGVIVKASNKPFRMKADGTEHQFGAGSLMIPLKGQKIPESQVREWINHVGSFVQVRSTQTGMSLSGPDLGSRSFYPLELPRVLLMTGDGVSSTEAGEKWWIMDQLVGLPITRMDLQDFRRADLDRYNVIVLVSGSYGALTESQLADIKAWTNGGGTLIAQRTAVSFLINKKLASEEFVSSESADTPRRNYDLAGEYRGARQIGGSIYAADIDTTHPLGFGFGSRSLSVYRNHSIFMKPSENPYNTVVQYDQNPLLGGYISAENLQMVSNSASVIASGSGRGRIVMLLDNPNFRGFWKGTDRLFLNAVFYRSLIR